MFTIDEDTATIRVYPENYAGDISRLARERITQMLVSDCRTLAVSMSRLTGVTWKVTVKPYEGL